MGLSLYDTSGPTIYVGVKKEESFSNPGLLLTCFLVLQVSQENILVFIH